MSKVSSPCQHGWGSSGVCHGTLTHSSSTTDPSLHPALHTQHILITLVKVFQMYYEKYTQELFYFFYLQSNTKHCVTADHYLTFPWMLALSHFCSHFYSDYFCSSLLSDTVTFSLASTQNKAVVPQHVQTPHYHFCISLPRADFVTP